MQNNFIGRQSAKTEADSRSMLQWICRSVLADYPVFRDVGIDACFYPYIGLTHTIRRKGAKWMVRISDHCRFAPKPVLEAIVMILGSKIVHRRPLRKFVEVYESFRKNHTIVESVRERRRLKGRKRIAIDRGKYYFPGEICKEMNDRFFNNQVEIRRIGWGPRRSWARLGHYDPIHHTITLSPALDSPRVPEYVVRYIIYHEMLHAVFEDIPYEGFRKHHPPEFRRAEAAYPDFALSKKFLNEYFGKRRRISDD
jgi:hypothetical protein